MSKDKLLEAYKNAEPIYLAVDCLVIGFKNSKLHILLLERDEVEGKPQYGLIFRMVKKNESVDESAKKAIIEHTGTDDFFLDQLRSFGDVNRDPIKRTVSVAYYALTRFSDIDENVITNIKAKWFACDALPQMLFDHKKIVQSALQELKIRVQYKPIGQKLLPKKFTMSELRSLYEFILESKLDRRNFSRKLNALQLLVKLKEKNTENSKRGAYYHAFNNEVYNELLTKGLKLEM